MTQPVRLRDFLGENLEEEFLNFDLTEIQEVLKSLNQTDINDIAHAEMLQLQALRGADIITEYWAKIVKTVSYLESLVNSTKNKVSMNYIAPDGARTTLDMKKWAGETSDEVLQVQERLAVAKGSKVFLEKKYDILIKLHHHFKDIAGGLRKSILGYSLGATEKTPEGYE